MNVGKRGPMTVHNVEITPPDTGSNMWHVKCSANDLDRRLDNRVKAREVAFGHLNEVAIMQRDKDALKTIVTYATLDKRGLT